MRDRERAVFRRDRVGMVFQFFRLLAHLTVEENVTLPARIAGDLSRRRRRARELLERVGLESRAGDRIDALSGGEQQRVAICRALLRSPSLLLADEPTGNLDDESAAVVMDLMLQIAEEEGKTLSLRDPQPRGGRPGRAQARAGQRRAELQPDRVNAPVS